MWGHCLRHRPYIKQHMSAGRVAHRKRLRHRPPHLTATCMRVELMVSRRRRQRAKIKKTFFEKLMNIQYLNHPPYPNRWMVWLIQQGLAWRPRCVKTCCQEDEGFSALGKGGHPALGIFIIMMLYKFIQWRKLIRPTCRHRVLINIISSLQWRLHTFQNKS